MLKLYLNLSLTSFKTIFQQKQLALYKSYASAQSGNPDQSGIVKESGCRNQFRTNLDPPQQLILPHAT